jgi:hypothetical protein
MVAGVAIFHMASLSAIDFAPDDVALGRNTVAFTARLDGAPIAGPLPDLPALIAKALTAGEQGRPLVLWLGASQLYAINNPEPGDRPAVAFAAEAARRRGSGDAWLQCASPNANANEILCMFLAFRQAGALPRRLVLAFTYDDLKEVGIRDSALSALAPLDGLTQEIGGSAAAQVESERARFAFGASGAATTTAVLRSVTSGTPQAVLEDALVAKLERHWSAWAARGKLEALAVTWWKMPVTTLAFRLFDRPQVFVPAEQAEWNLAALRALFDLAAADGTRVLVYQAPHNPGLTPFYHPRAEYDRAQALLAAECAARGFDWLDLETLVPAGLWGETNNFTPDVFHYRVEGHRLLGEAIEAAVAQRDG